MEDVIHQHAEQLKRWKKKQKEICKNLLKINKIRNKRFIYNERKKSASCDRYYEHIASSNGLKCYFKRITINERTHIRRIPYFLSKDYYLYTWSICSRMEQ
ncbi:DUF2031 domain-containing protein [Anoxybacillus flavithermus]|uniref:DUF2031 domain-containing protein n=1 Tax=Anoxybacillus flavithermus TaxID=33934 RepID=UPI0018AD2135